MQITGGSTSTWMEFDRYRQAGAAARLLLVEAAAKRFNVAPRRIRTESGVVIAGDRHATYGELADDAGKLPSTGPCDHQAQGGQGLDHHRQTHQAPGYAGENHRPRQISAWTCSSMA